MQYLNIEIQIFCYEGYYTCDHRTIFIKINKNKQCSKSLWFSFIRHLYAFYVYIYVYIYVVYILYTYTYTYTYTYLLCTNIFISILHEEITYNIKYYM